MGECIIEEKCACGGFIYVKGDEVYCRDVHDRWREDHIGHLNRSKQC